MYNSNVERLFYCTRAIPPLTPILLVQKSLIFFRIKRQFLCRFIILQARLRDLKDCEYFSLHGFFSCNGNPKSNQNDVRMTLYGRSLTSYGDCNLTLFLLFKTYFFIHLPPDTLFFQAGVLVVF